jgi:hypothetical protein
LKHKFQILSNRAGLFKGAWEAMEISWKFGGDTLWSGVRKTAGSSVKEALNSASLNSHGEVGGFFRTGNISMQAPAEAISFLRGRNDAKSIHANFTPVLSNLTDI